MLAWSDLVLKYQKHINKSTIIPAEDTPLFNNEEIKRKLSLEDREFVFEELERTGHAAPLDKKRTEWEVYWHTLDEWGNLVYSWAVKCGMMNSVCTLYEIINGDDSVSEEFHGLDQGVLVKALKALEAKGKCELISFDGNEGVKFF